MKKILAYLIGTVVILVIAGGIILAASFGFILVDYDETPPTLPANLDGPSILVFSKAAGYVHVDALPAGKALLEKLAVRNGWSIFQTDNGAVMSEQLLAQFHVVVWNNTSGTTLNEEQQQAFRQYLENGGGFVGIHAAGGDPWYSWKWYVNGLLGAQFIGHTINPQFQDAEVQVLAPADPIVSHLPPRWHISQEEWYGFDTNVRDKGYTVLLSVDENTYDPNDSGMEGEHPSTWKREIGKGRMFYTAIGHQKAIYDTPEYQLMIENALRWTGRF